MVGHSGKPGAAGAAGGPREGWPGMEAAPGLRNLHPPALGSPPTERPAFAASHEAKADKSQSPGGAVRVRPVGGS